jgi:hypothetical protein
MIASEPEARYNPAAMQQQHLRLFGVRLFHF